MQPDPADTIVALSSPQGPGPRAIVRLSGTKAWDIAHSFFPKLQTSRPSQRSLQTADLQFTEPAIALAADLYFWPTPRTYTGQDVAEIHLLSSPPLVDLLITSCLNAGARAAQPGEFTLRAFLAGKLDLTRAEAVLGVIEAGTRDELKQALAQLAGGVSRPLQNLRDDLLNLLADVEAGLDFSEEDISFVQEQDLLDRLAKALALVTLVRRQIEQRATAPRPFRAVLAGPPNAGKSSLFNALAGRDAAIVSQRTGTTRDFLEATLFHMGVQILLVDTAGLRSPEDPLEGAAQNLGREQVADADAILWCRKATLVLPDDWLDWFPGLPAERIVKVATKCDLHEAAPGYLPTSALTGERIDNLRAVLVQRARSRRLSPLAPSLSRCRHHVDACLAHLRQAHACALHQDPAELLALELRGALDELGAMVGALYTDDLLDRIFSRFCIGK
jgi:tRNA modification GTPase